MAESRPFAVVTGASSGIGRELAQQFAGHGFDVLITGADGGLDAAAGELAHGGTVIREVLADLASPEEAERVVAAIAAIGRPVDALALTAGTGASGAFIDVPLADEQHLIAVTVGATVHLAKQIVPDMVRRGSGRVLLTAPAASSSAGATAAGSQAFIESFADGLRQELDGTGVTVTSMLPGPADDPAEVARDGFAALMAGRRQVVAGSVQSKLQVAGARLIPAQVRSAAGHVPGQVRAAVHARMTRPKES